MKSFIEKFNYIKPPKSLSSAEIEIEIQALYDRLHLSVGRLELMTGIKQRGFWPIGTMPSSIAAEAAKPLVDGDIDLLIHASVCRDFLEPATASVVHYKLGLSEHCEIFDLSNACLGVLSAIHLAQHLVENKIKKKVLIVSGENSGPLLLPLIDSLKKNHQINRQDFKKYLASLTIGSAAIALIISAQESSYKLNGSVSLTDSKASSLCQGGGNSQELFMETDSEELLKAGIILATKTFEQFKVKFPSIQKIIPHQVGLVHREKIKLALGISDIPDFSCFETWGNTGSAALPLTFMLAHEKDFFRSKDHLSWLGIGSGLVTHFYSLERLS